MMHYKVIFCYLLLAFYTHILSANIVSKKECTSGDSSLD